MAEKRKILVASSNPGKVAELRAMLDADVDWVGLDAFESLCEVVEDGMTFAENARKKAVGYSKQAGLWTLADDSGLVVDALGGEPGVKSARYSGEKAGDRELVDQRNMEKVLRKLQGVERQKRTARFVCRICLVDGEQVLAETEGRLEGIIAAEPIGQGGFGYDPIFFVPELNKTVAQLSTEQKNAISHRGRAIGKFKPLLEKKLAPDIGAG